MQFDHSVSLLLIEYFHCYILPGLVVALPSSKSQRKNASCARWQERNKQKISACSALALRSTTPYYEYSRLSRSTKTGLESSTLVFFFPARGRLFLVKSNAEVSYTAVAQREPEIPMSPGAGEVPSLLYVLRRCRRLRDNRPDYADVA